MSAPNVEAHDRTRPTGVAATRPLTRGFSAFLDMTRFVTALVVLLGHFGSEQISHSLFYVFSWISHSAVMVFFVLSGYVIAFVTEKKERDLPTYALSRFCRIYSVVLPAIVLTVILDLWGKSIRPDFYRPFTYFETDTGIAQIVSSLFFMNENWWVRLGLFSNGAFWSLNNEVWYYIAFAIIVWTTHRWVRALLLLGCALVVGPKIVLLAPVWFMGVLVRRLEGRFALSRTWAMVALLGSFAAVLLWDGIEHADQLFPGFESPKLTLLGAPVVIPVRDYIVGLLISVAFLAAARWVRDWNPAPRSLAAIRWCAGMTFSLYLFHRPILLFLAAALPGSIEDNGKRVAVLAIGLVAIALLSYATERQKDRMKSSMQALARQFGGRPATSATGP